MKSWKKGGNIGASIIGILWIIILIYGIIEAKGSDAAFPALMIILFAGLILIGVGYLIGAIVGLIVGKIREENGKK